MCGICGFLASPGPESGLEATARRMAGTIAHRGPDGDGVWADGEAGIAFGHRRLAIVELSPLGRQPMESADGRWVIAYNGEIYNFQDLRAELEAAGHQFRGHSDTEVLLEGCAAWGVERTVRRLVGIFAFALWDRRERTLFLVRDHLGVKPLYWARMGGALLFGSQPKALRAHPAFAAEIDRDALSAYLRFSYVPAPHSIYQGVHKLEPGSILTVRPGRDPERIVYWDAGDAARAGIADRLALSDAAATDALESLLKDAVGRQMMADVPLGAFLSGGIDSSTVVALMQAQSARPVRTFTIGFGEDGYDEAVHARAVAAHLGTEHTELRVEASHALEVIPKLADWYDEPFADSSQIPTLLVSEMTRRSVTVALSGDGGDELFAGYNRYITAPALWRR
ncbi:asparagine synthase (glutamine-hydrolyzing), partial [Azospirillum brasilense]